MKFVSLFVFVILLTTACGDSQVSDNNQPAPPETKPTELPKSQFVRQMEKAHQVDNFYQKDAVAFDLQLTWGGTPSLNGRVTSMTNSSKVRLDKADGTSTIFNGEAVYFAPDTADASGARFGIFTWQYFVMAPFKYSDPGTNWEMLGALNLEPGQPRDAAKLTFGAGVGDAPDDWYIAFKNPNTNLTDGLAYIVTGGTRSQEEAEKKVSAVTYHDYQTVAGVPLPTKMKFWSYNMETGLERQRGEADISAIKFMTAAEADFSVPKNSKLVE